MTAELRGEGAQLLEELSRVVRDLDSAEHSAAAIPDEADIATAMSRLQETAKEFGVLADRCRRLDAEVADLAVPARRDRADSF